MCVLVFLQAYRYEIECLQGAAIFNQFILCRDPRFFLCDHFFFAVFVVECELGVSLSRIFSFDIAWTGLDTTASCSKTEEARSSGAGDGVQKGTQHGVRSDLVLRAWEFADFFYVSQGKVSDCHFTLVVAKNYKEFQQC